MSLLRNPIVQRELFGMLRTKQALALQTAFLFTFVILVILRWPTDTVVDLDGTQSHQVFSLFGYSVLSALIIFVPIFPATSIVREKNKGTLQLLIVSPMSSWSIYIGKLVGMLGFVLLLLSLSAPAIAACYTMGGVDLFKEVIPLYGLLLLASIQYAVLGLLVSSYVNSTDTAIRITYAVVLILSVIVLVPNFFVESYDNWVADAAMRLKCVSPFPAAMEILGHRDVGSKGLSNEVIATTSFNWIAAISIIGMALQTVSRLNIKIMDVTRDQGVITDELETGEKFFRLIWYIGIFDPQKRSAAIPWYLNPVMIKEFRCRRFGRRHWLMRLIATCAIVSLLLTVTTTLSSKDWGVATIGGFMVLLQVTLVTLLSPGLAAGLLTSEQESGGWALLLTTPQGWPAILSGKLLSVVWPLLLVLASTLPGYMVMYFVEPAMAPQIQRVLICLVMTSLLAVSLSAFVSGLCKRTSVSTTVSFSLLITLLAGTMLFWLGRDAPFNKGTVESVLRFNPLAASLSAINTPGFTDYDLIPFNWYIILVASGILLAGVSYRTWKLTLPQ